jgi:hypothetical protein
MYARHIIKAAPKFPNPEWHVTKHFKYSDMLCRGFEKDPCRAEPPFRVRFNLERVFLELAEPFVQYLSDRMIRKKVLVAQSYLCPKCLALRGRPSHDCHGIGRAVDLKFTGGQRLHWWSLDFYAINWILETGVECTAYPEGTCLHLALDDSIGLTFYEPGEWVVRTD